MARARRRSTRTSTQKAPDSADAEQPDTHADDEPEEHCPECQPGATASWAAADKESWVRCDACKVWFHWRCAGSGDDLDALDKWSVRARAMGAGLGADSDRRAGFASRASTRTPPASSL